MGKTDAEDSYDYSTFAILVYEFTGDEAKKTDQKIRNTLHRKHLGAYDAVRVDRLRRLKNDLQHELRSGRASRFYIGPTSQFASPADFDQAALVNDLSCRYPEFDS